MDWRNFTLDTTLNIEGIIAALAILGATIGFIFNMVKNWRNEFKEKRYMGTNSIILDILEQNFENGLSEDELWKSYSSKDTVEKRKAFKAYAPSKLTRYGFERQLKHLQGRFLIRLTGPGHYHVDFDEPKRWKRFYQLDRYQNIVAQIQNDIGQSELNKIINSVINNDDLSFYRSSEAHSYLIDKGDIEAISKIISNLKSSDLNIRKRAIELFIELHERSRP